MGRRKKGRDVDGVLLLDKPLGASSNAVLQRARRLFDARKAGHTGSLDPLATGLLPICFGEATKLSAWLLHADKRYRVTADLRFETNTGDREGQPTAHASVQPPSADELNDLLQWFVGEQMQTPPMYSALKRDGRPLYELARAGEVVERQPRPITVSRIDVLHYADHELTLEVAVSRGTYIRTLIEDIARAWGGAAHVATLRRTGVGTYDDSAMVDFEQLQEYADCGPVALDAVLEPASKALNHWPAASLCDEDVKTVSNGQAVALSDPPVQPGPTRIMNNSGGFLGLGEVDDAGQLAPKRMFTRVLS